MSKNVEIGKKGEKIASDFLKNKNYEILETNWRHKKLEIDIIAKHQNTIVIVEVKTRKSELFGEPETFVDKKKQKFLFTAANEYILKHMLTNDARFDIISILLNNNKYKIKHIENAFSFFH